MHEFLTVCTALVITLSIGGSDALAGEPEQTRRVPLGATKLVIGSNSLLAEGEPCVEEDGGHTQRLRCSPLVKQAIDPGTRDQYMVTSLADFTVNITCEYFWGEGAAYAGQLACWSVDTIAPSQSLRFDLWTISSLPDAWFGYVIVSANGPIEGTMLDKVTPTPSATPTASPSPSPSPTITPLRVPLVMRGYARPRSIPPFDDGVPEGLQRAGQEGNYVGVHYNIAPAASVREVSYYWQEEMRPVRLIVWDGGWDVLHEETLTPSAGWWTWVLPSGVMAPQSEVYVGFQCLSDYTQDGPWIGLDRSDPDGETYAGPWPPELRDGFDAMIRVTVR